VESRRTRQLERSASPSKNVARTFSSKIRSSCNGMERLATGWRSRGCRHEMLAGGLRETIDGLSRSRLRRRNCCASISRGGRDGRENPGSASTTPISGPLGTGLRLRTLKALKVLDAGC
jgi:hypothetical protein